MPAGIFHLCIAGRWQNQKLPGELARSYHYRQGSFLAVEVYQRERNFIIENKFNYLQTGPIECKMDVSHIDHPVRLDIDADWEALKESLSAILQKIQDGKRHISTQ